MSSHWNIFIAKKIKFRNSGFCFGFELAVAPKSPDVEPDFPAALSVWRNISALSASSVPLS
jgi:hypothetical protein